MNKNVLDKIDLEEFQGAVKAVMEKFNTTEEEAEKYIMSWGPKRLKAYNLLTAGESWRDGHTKQKLEKRVKNRRKKNKQARKARRANR